jgi:uncharacterized membrane protein YqgA involved in biofilm formation
MKREIGCGLWLVWLLLAVFAGEWVLLGVAIKMVPREQLPFYVLSVVIATIVGGWIAVYFRIQRKVR